MYAIKRSGFAMIMAIFVVFLVALGGTFLLQDSTMGSETIGTHYLQAQAELLADSATEFGVMRAQGFDRTGGDCLTNLNISVFNSGGANATNRMFDINITYAYSFRGQKFNGNCVTLDENTSKDTMILMDVTVRDHNLTSENIRVSKRSWQKL